MTKSLKISAHRSLWNQLLFYSNSSRWQCNQFFPKRETVFSLSNTYIENKRKTKSISVYFVTRGRTQFRVIFCLGKAQNTILFHFSFLHLVDLENITKSDRNIHQRDAFIYLRQCVIDVFCSTSTERSRKSSSLLLTCSKKYTRKADLVKHHASKCCMYLRANAIRWNNFSK